MQEKKLKASLMVELSTNISNLRELKKTDLRYYDAVYLGNNLCLDYEDNFLQKTDDIQKGVEYLKKLGKKAFITTLAVPRNRDLDSVRKTLNAALKAGIDAVEVHNMGTLRIADKLVPGIPKHVGILANIYTSFSSEKLKEYGVTRITPNPEVTLDEIKVILDKSKVEVSFLLHGKIPLGVTDSCFLLDKNAGKCPDVCKETFWLKSNQWVIKNVGKGIYSGKDLCMLEHLDLLLKTGLKYFKVESLYENPGYRSKVGEAYKSTFLSGSLNGKLLNEILMLSEHGICNGYYFAKSGRYYVDKNNKIYENKVYGEKNG